MLPPPKAKAQTAPAWTVPVTNPESFANHLPTIPPLRGERAGVRAGVSFSRSDQFAIPSLFGGRRQDRPSRPPATFFSNFAFVTCQFSRFTSNYKQRLFNANYRHKENYEQ